MGTSQEKDVVHRSIERGTSEVMNKHLRGAEIDTSEVPNSGLQEVPKTVLLYNKSEWVDEIVGSLLLSVEKSADDGRLIFCLSIQTFMWQT